MFDKEQKGGHGVGLGTMNRKRENRKHNRTDKGCLLLLLLDSFCETDCQFLFIGWQKARECIHGQLTFLITRTTLNSQILSLPVLDLSCSHYS